LAETVIAFTAVLTVLFWVLARGQFAASAALITSSSSALRLVVYPKLDRGPSPNSVDALDHFELEASILHCYLQYEC
jgi:hypothetical protein